MRDRGRLLHGLAAGLRRAGADARALGLSLPLFKHYRQFEGMSEEEVNVGKRADAAERRAKELARVEPLDLARTTWPDYPPPVIVNAITYAARRGLHRYIDRHATTLRGELAHLHAVPAGRLVVGDGAAQLLTAAAQALLEPDDELITPWPSYALYPLMARRARGHAVPVPGFSVDGILSAVNPRTRVVAIANPNDPTGELIGVAELRRLLTALPERVVVLLDEALRHYVDAEAQDAALRLVDGFPRLLVFRTFSKAWGLAGLRVGYARAARARARPQRARAGRGAGGAAHRGRARGDARRADRARTCRSGARDRRAPRALLRPVAGQRPEGPRGRPARCRARRPDGPHERRGRRRRAAR